MRKWPLVPALADKTKFFETADPVEKKADAGVAKTALVRIPLRVRTGVTVTFAEGDAERTYEKMNKDELDPMYLLASPYTEDGKLVKVRSLQQGVVTTILRDRTEARDVPSPA